MRPKECYDNTAARARKLLTLHDGLINIRQRKMRADWKAKFCQLMHWAQNSELERVDTKDAIIVLRHQSDLTAKEFSQEIMDDLLRCALTFGISALDRYVHERVVKGIVTALKEKMISRRQEEFSIPAVLAIKISGTVAKARKAGKNVRPANEIRRNIQELLHKKPFQSWREIEYAFDLIGITGVGGELTAAYGVGDFSMIRNQLNRIVQRRNQIVHEGDLVRHARGGQVRMQRLSRKYVEDSLDFLDLFVGHLDAIAP